MALVLLTLLGAIDTQADVPEFSAQWQGDHIVVRWRTDQEIGTQYFELRRSSSEQGPWEDPPLTDVEACDTPGEGCEHLFTDTSVTQGQSYWYRLEEFVAMSPLPLTYGPVEAAAETPPTNEPPTATATEEPSPTATVTPSPTATASPSPTASRPPATATATRGPSSPAPPPSATPLPAATQTPEIASPAISPLRPTPTLTSEPTATQAPTRKVRTPAPGSTPPPDVLPPSALSATPDPTPAAPQAISAPRLLLYIGGAAVALGAVLALIALIGRRVR